MFDLSRNSWYIKQDCQERETSYQVPNLWREQKGWNLDLCKEPVKPVSR